MLLFLNIMKTGGKRKTPSVFMSADMELIIKTPPLISWTDYISNFAVYNILR